MKKLLTTALFVSTFASLLQADIIYPDGSKSAPEPYATRRLARGFSNILTSIFEVPKTMFVDLPRDEGITNPSIITLGLTEGFVKAFRRLNSGFSDLGTGLVDLGEYGTSVYGPDYTDKYAASWEYSKRNESAVHLDPEFIGPLHMIPGYYDQFTWEGADTTPANHYR